ncbi:MAG: Hsp20/alpha crystallin family protein [Alphaproteobacteria bacterium]|nr:Hsp20/alpha crystallin family protein [Alphaproteobacteria bacterium]
MAAKQIDVAAEKRSGDAHLGLTELPQTPQDLLRLWTWEAREFVEMQQRYVEEMQEFLRRLGFPVLPGWWSAALGARDLDVTEKDGAFEVRAALPGYKPSEVDLEVKGDLVIIRARKEGEHEAADQAGKLRSRELRQTQRVVRLAGPVDVDAASASFGRGTLTAILPRMPAAGESRRIAVEGGEAP